MKAIELNELTTEELRQKEQEFKRNLFNLRFQVATNQQENTAGLRQARKAIARVKTLLRQRELRGEQGE
mgnify:CR=1 FL=1